MKTLGRVAPRAAFSGSCSVCPSVREEAPSPPIGLDPAFPRTQTILKGGGNMRFKVRVFYQSNSVSSPDCLSYILEKLQVGEFLPPCCFLLSVPLNSRAAEWATAGKKERKKAFCVARFTALCTILSEGRTPDLRVRYRGYKMVIHVTFLGSNRMDILQSSQF